MCFFLCSKVAADEDSREEFFGFRTAGRKRLDRYHLRKVVRIMFHLERAVNFKRGCR